MSQSVSQSVRKSGNPPNPPDLGNSWLLLDPRFDFSAVNRSALAGSVERPISSSDASPAPKNSTVTVNDGRRIDRPKLIRVSELWGDQTPAVQEKYGQTAGEVMPAIADDYQFSIRLRSRDDCYSGQARIDVRVTDNEVWLCETVDLRMEKIDRDLHDSVRDSIRAAVSEHLDNKLDIVETQGNVHTRRRLRLEVRFLDNYDGVQSEIYPIRVRPGSGRADSATLYLNSSPKTIAHEMAHRLLAAVDEYEDSESRMLAPLRLLAYEGIEKESLKGPQPSLMKESEVGVLLPRHGLAIAGILRHATDSGGEQTKFSVAFPLDVEDETSENFLWKRSYHDLSLLDYQFENVHKFLKCNLYIQGEENLLRLLVLAETFKGEEGAKFFHEITSTEDTRERHLKIIDAFQHLVDNLPGLPPRDQKVVVRSIAMFAWECDRYRFGYFSELEFLSGIKEELEDFHPAEFMQAARDKVAYSGWVDLGRFDMEIELSAQEFLEHDSERLIGRSAPTLDALPSDTVAFLEEKRPGALAGLRERLSHQTDEIVKAVHSSNLDTRTLGKEPGLIVDLPQGIVEYDVGHELTEGQKKAVYSSSDFRREDLSDWQRSRGYTPRRPTVRSHCSHLAKLTRLQVSDIEPLNSITEETWFQHYLRRYEQAYILETVHQLSRVGRYSPTRAPKS